jgi:hypothetical protein
VSGKTHNVSVFLASGQNKTATSARAVIYNEKGEVLSYLDLPRNPDVVLLDTDIIVQAPVRLLISGMGDALSTYFEAESCRKKCAANSTCGAGHEHPGTMTSYVIAEACYRTLLEYGQAAVTSAKAKAVTPGEFVRQELSARFVCVSVFFPSFFPRRNDRTPPTRNRVTGSAPCRGALRHSLCDLLRSFLTHHFSFFCPSLILFL